MLKNAELVSARRFAGVSNSRRAPWSNTNTLSQYDMMFSMLCETIRRVELRKRRENDVSIRSSNLVLKVDVDSSKTTHLDSSARGKYKYVLFVNWKGFNYTFSMCTTITRRVKPND